MRKGLYTMDNNEILSQVLSRVDEINYKKSEKRRKLFSATAGILSVAFIIGLSVMMPSMMRNTDTSSFIGGTPVASLLASPALAGYVVVGLVSFLLGATLTLLCQCLQKKNERK